MATFALRLDMETFSSLFVTSKFAMVLFMMALSASRRDILHFMALMSSSVPVVVGVLGFFFTRVMVSKYSSCEGSEGTEPML